MIEVTKQRLLRAQRLVNVTSKRGAIPTRIIDARISVTFNIGTTERASHLKGLQAVTCGNMIHFLNEMGIKVAAHTPTPFTSNLDKAFDLARHLGLGEAITFKTNDAMSLYSAETRYTKSTGKHPALIVTNVAINTWLIQNDGLETKDE